MSLFYSGPAEDDPTAAVYGEKQIVSAPGHFQVTFRARERHVTTWTQLTDRSPAIVEAGPADSMMMAIWDTRLCNVSVFNYHQLEFTFGTTHGVTVVRSREREIAGREKLKEPVNV